MGKRKVLFGSALCILSVLAIVFLYRYRQEKNTYSCYRIPIAGGRLDQGMDTDEVISIAGEPSSMKHEEYMDILNYDALQPCDLGDCTQAVFYIGVDDKSYDNGIFSSGLGIIEVTVDDSSKEAIFRSLVDFYGNLSPDGGETKWKRSLRPLISDILTSTIFVKSGEREPCRKDPLTAYHRCRKQ